MRKTYKISSLVNTSTPFFKSKVAKSYKFTFLALTFEIIVGVNVPGRVIELTISIYVRVLVYCTLQPYNKACAHIAIFYRQ